MTTAYDRVTERLAERTGYVAARPGADWRCPAHNDKSPSLSVTPTPDKVLIHCQAGCDAAAVMSALDLSLHDLYDDAHTNGNGRSSYGAPVAVYPYQDASGAIMFEVVRYAGKEFRQRTPDKHYNDGYRPNAQGVDKPLYRLPQVLDAIRNNVRVWVVEGEKDVESFERRGEVATCNAMGAGKWKHEYARTLAGADVIVVADRDEAGVNHARDVVASLSDVAKSVNVVTAAVGKDASDHFAAGRGIQDFVPANLENGGTIDTGEVVSGAKDATQGPDFVPFTRVELDISKKPTPRPTCGNYLYRGGFTVFQSEPGVGKTWLALNEVLRILTNGGVVLYFDEEGGEDLMHERLYALGAKQHDVAERFFYFPFEARLWSDADLTALRAIIAEAGEVGVIELAVFDSLPDFLAAAGLSEDSAKDVTTFVNRVLGTLREHGIAQVALDHLIKPTTESKKERSRYSRGSGSKLAKADATVLIETVEAFDATKSGKLRVWKTKDRYGRLDVPRIDEPGRVLDVVVQGGCVEITTATTPVKEWTVPRECLAKLVEVLRTVGSIGLTYNKLVEVMPYRRETVKAALDRLAAEGVLRYRPGPRNSLVWYLNDGVEQIYFDLLAGDFAE